MEHKKGYHSLAAAFTALLFLSAATAADTDEKKLEYGFEGGVTTASKYIWRGQRLTNDWSLQPTATLSVGGLSFNFWGNLDLAAVNEGDALPIPENPAAPPGSSGLKGKFSEIDYTISYLVETEPVSVDLGTIFYTFPERSASLPATTELYGGVTLNRVPLAPSAKLFVDVDESGEGDGSPALYLLLSGTHQIPFRHSRFPGLDLSASLSFVNTGFCRFYYGEEESGAHDFAFTVSAPINLGENWSAAAFITYSTLLGEFRDHQFVDPREVYRGTAGSPATFADTVWGGLSLNLAF